MQLSRRIRNINPDGDDGWLILYRARELIARGEKIVNLTIGDHDWTTPAPILAAVERSMRAGNTSYPAMSGTTALRAAIARRMQAATGVPTGPENVIVTTGAQGALFAALTATLDPGDRLVMVQPNYVTYPDTARAVEAAIVRVEALSEDGFQPRRAALVSACRGARALLVNSPNNPTGAVYTRETVEAVCEVARTHDLWLISDEVYAGQVHEGRHISPRSLPGMSERTLVVSSLSKSHVMTGFRVGWVAGPAEVMERIGDLAITTTYGIPGFIQDAAVWAIENGAAIERETAAVFARRRDRAMTALAGASAVRLVAPQGAMFIMLDIRSTGLSGEAFAARLLEEERIAVMPGESFGPAAAGHLRVALTIEDEALAEALGRLAALAGRLAG